MPHWEAASAQACVLVTSPHNHHPVGLFPLENRLKLSEYVGRLPGCGTGLDVQVIIRRGQVKLVEKYIAHHRVVMLTGMNNF